MGGHAGLRPSVVRSLLALALAALVFAALHATSALAAETTIGFDHLPGGAEVTTPVAATTQWETEGLKLGFAEGKVKPGKGNCGPPTVKSEAETGVPAASKPNYALLTRCASTATSGTYGVLLDHPRGKLSIEAQSLPGGSSQVPVTLTAYDSEGTSLGSAEGNAEHGAWTRITFANPSNAQVAYFGIEAPTPNMNEIVIDNLSFESPPSSGEEPKSTTTEPTKPPSPMPPTANVALSTPEPAAGKPLTLSGAGSTAGSGHIISYGWDLNGDGTIDTSTGTNPIAHVILTPGPHTIGLTVTNSNGEKATTRFSLSVPTLSHVHLPDSGEGECQPTLEVGDAQLLAECIQKLPGGGYVIGGPELDVNGMMLVPKSGGFMKIKTVTDYALLGGGTVTELYGAQVYVELLNTPIGDMVLGERNLEAEPMDLEVHAAPRLTLQGPLNHSLRAPAHVADDERPSKTLLMEIGVGQKCEGSESKKAGCCPPSNANTACATLPGNFPLKGQIAVYLTNKGQALFDVQVGLNLKSVQFEATGALEIRANLEKGIELQSLQFEIGEASLAPIFKVKKASFVYYFPEYEEESKRDSWQAKGTITFGEEIVELEAELSFKKGEFHSAAMKFKAKPGVPIYPGVALNEIGASVEVNPLAFGGSLGASIAELLELELAFKFREETTTELGFFGGQGKLSYKEDEIATLAADVYTDGYIDAQVKFDLHFPFDSDEPLIKVLGEIGFWDEPASGLWQAKGYVYMKIWEISAEVAGLINNEYAAGCLEGEALGVSGGIQGRYRFSDGNISGGVFAGSHCTDQLKQYSEKPLKKHSGGFVKEEGLRFARQSGGALAAGLGTLGGADTAGASAAAAAGEGETLTLPNGTLGQELRITSPSGTPVVTLVGPGGQTFTTPPAPGHVVGVREQYTAVVAPNHDQVLVLLLHPQGGEWRIEPAAGSPPISKLEVAEDVAPATVRVRVKHKGGRRWSLAYKIGHFVPGSKVRFVERGRDSTHVLGTVAKANGTLSFSPQEGLSRARTVYAYMLDTEGAPTRELTVGSYTAPAAFRPSRPRHVRFVRHDATALISWGAVAGARVYRIKIVGSDGRLETLSRKPGSLSVTVPNVLPFESFTATVTAVGGPDRLSGVAATAKLSAVKPPKAAPRRHSHKHR